MMSSARRPDTVSYSDFELTQGQNPFISPAISTSTWAPEHNDDPLRSDDERLLLKPFTSSTTPTLTVTGTPLNEPISRYEKLATSGFGWRCFSLKLSSITVVGFGVAIGHHIMYERLNQKRVDETLSQTTIKFIGNALVNLVLAILKVVISDSYNQYIWLIVRRKPLKVGTLNKAFSLLDSPKSLFSLDLFREAKIGILMAFFSWLLLLGGSAPPATLSVIPGKYSPESLAEQVFDKIPIPEYAAPVWHALITQQTQNSIEPSPEMIRISSQSALAMAIIAPTEPLERKIEFKHYSFKFRTEFYGPTVQCSNPEADQQNQFNEFAENLRQAGSAYTSSIYLASQSNKSESTGYPNFLVFSAFSPTTSIANSHKYNTKGGKQDPTGNWNANFTRKDEDFNNTQQLWVQTANSSIACSLVNASFVVDLTYTDRKWIVAPRSVIRLPSDRFANGIFVKSYIPEADEITKAYFTTFQSLGNMIFGNISLEKNGGCLANRTKAAPCNSSLAEASSRVLSTGLIACDEITHSFWQETYGLLSGFRSKPWMCRNHTLSRAIEDLADNITISMLSARDFTKYVSGFSTLEADIDIYKYDKQTLLSSYGVVFALTLIASAIGIYSLVRNGAYQDTSFSTFMKTTRNSELDTISDGAYLGIDEEMKETKLMFGVIGDKRKNSNTALGAVGASSDYQHAAFGLETTVRRLSKRMS